VLEVINAHRNETKVVYLSELSPLLHPSSTALLTCSRYVPSVTYTDCQCVWRWLTHHENGRNSRNLRQLCLSTNQIHGEQADSYPVCHGIPRLLWKLKVHYHAHNSPPTDSTLNHIDPHTHSFFKTYFNIFILPHASTIGSFAKKKNVDTF
jgi:hypothetical protein